jgi:hypothetical protein
MSIQSRELWISISGFESLGGQPDFSTIHRAVRPEAVLTFASPP